MKRYILPTFLVLTVVLSATGFAQAPGKSIVAASAVSNSQDSKLQLFSVGKGIRKKKVVLFNVQVYEAELLVTKPKEFLGSITQATALDALGKMEGASIRLKLLRTVGSDKMRESFSDALKANHVDPASPKMNEFFKKIAESPSFDEGKEVAISAEFGKGTLTYENPEGKISVLQADRKEILNLFSIWLGTPADGGLATLKNELIGKGK